MALEQKRLKRIVQIHVFPKRALLSECKVAQVTLCKDCGSGRRDGQLMGVQ